jgi:tyrosinase
VKNLMKFANIELCRGLIDSINNRPVRQSATSAAAVTDLATYAAAVTAMQALPASDPRNWTKQAEIHQNFCPYGNWYFLPWHRAYLYFFEQICRELTGVNDFALPYWNWQADRSIPTPYWSGALNHSPRSAGPTSQAGLSYIGPSVIEGILDLTNFEQFGSYASTALRGGAGGGYGEIESTPHNNIHGFVGGTMGSFMSPLDSIFWSHHNMVDCLWDTWNNKRSNLNTSDTDWTQFNLPGMFVDGKGDPAEMTCGLTVILPLISYRFGASTKGQALQFTGALSRAALERGGNIRHVVRRRFQVANRLTLSPQKAATFTVKADARLMDRLLTQGPNQEQVLLQISDLKLPKADDSFIRVFLNMPDATAATSIDSPNYAGSFGFFMGDMVARMSTDGRSPAYYVDVTDTLQALRKAGQISGSEPLQLTLVSVPHETGDRKPDSIGIGSLELVTTPTAVRGK